MAATATANDLLKATARSFYLTLRVLPASVRPQIGLGYLLARTTDTVADTEIVPLSQRLEALRAFRDRILGQSSAPLNLGGLVAHQGSRAERLLLENVEATVAALLTLSAPDRERVRSVLTTIISGQELDLQRFAGASAGKVIALQTAAELDDYTHRVAGCVGEFWTKIYRAHLFPDAKLDEDQLIADGIRFGRGLQLVNILRDLPADLKNGRCYLPMEKMLLAGLSPDTLLRPENEAKFLPLFRSHLDLAESHLDAGWRYTNTLPDGQLRARLACAWPILIGIRTIDKLRSADVAALQRRVKVAKSRVYWIILRSALACPVPFWWRRLYR